MSVSNLNANRGGYPASIKVWLSYTDKYALSAAGVVGAYQAMRANSVFDPDFTGTGGQPSNYDIYAALYDTYRVHQSRITVWFTAVGTNNATSNFDWVVLPTISRTSATSTINFNGSWVMPFAKHGFAGPNASSFAPRGYTISMSTMRMLGRNRVEFLGDDNLAAAFGSNPSRQWYWLIGVRAADETSTVPVIVRVQVDYYVEWYNRDDQDLDLSAKIDRLKLLQSMKRDFDQKIERKNPNGTLPPGDEDEYVQLPLIRDLGLPSPPCSRQHVKCHAVNSTIR